MILNFSIRAFLSNFRLRQTRGDLFAFCLASCTCREYLGLFYAKLALGFAIYQSTGSTCSLGAYLGNCNSISFNFSLSLFLSLSFSLSLFFSLSLSLSIIVVVSCFASDFDCTHTQWQIETTSEFVICVWFCRQKCFNSNIRQVGVWKGGKRCWGKRRLAHAN